MLSLEGVAYSMLSDTQRGAWSLMRVPYVAAGIPMSQHRIGLSQLIRFTTGQHQGHVGPRS